MIGSHLAVVGSLCFQKFPPSDPHFLFVIGHKHARTQRHTHTCMYTHAHMHMHHSPAAERPGSILNIRIKRLHGGISD